jgi:hypothetical protein
LSAARAGRLVKRRRLALSVAGVALVAVIGLLGSWLGTRDAKTRRAAAIGVSEPGVRADFNGDGFSDLAVGLPDEDIGGSSNAGAVTVVYGSADGLAAAGTGMLHAAEAWDQGRVGVVDDPEPNDRFGAAIATADFDGDSYSDLAVAVPREDSSAGAIHVFFGSAKGLTTADQQLLRPADLGVTGGLFGGASLSLAMAWGNFDGDAFGDLAFGAPLAGVGGNFQAGAVHVVYGSGSGLSPGRHQTWDQASLGPVVGAAAEPGDFFGTTLAAGNFNGDDADDLAVGVPGEDTVSLEDVGEVDILYGDKDGGEGLTAAGAQTRRQSSDSPEAGDRFASVLAAGDFNADLKDDLAIGVPGEDIGGLPDVGLVNVLGGSSSGIRCCVTRGSWTQDTVVDGSAVEDTVEDGDRFGDALVAGDFNGDGSTDLAIGVPREDVGDLMWGGAVNVIYGSPEAGLHPGAAESDELFHQDRSGIEGVIEGQELFGTALTAWNFGKGDQDDLAVGVPYEEVDRAEGRQFNAGFVNLIYGDASSGLTSAGDQAWTQDSEGVPDTSESGDRFGEVFVP